MQIEIQPLTDGTEFSFKEMANKEISYVRIGQGSVIVESKNIKYLTDNVKNKYLYQPIPFAKIGRAHV